MRDQLLGKQQNGSSSEAIYSAAWQIIAGLPMTGAKAALDLGGGAGNFAKRLARQGWRTTLADHHAASIDGITSVHADLNLELPFANNQFDLIVSLEVIEHLENPRHFFRELFRCARPGGHIVVSTPNQLSLASKICLVTRDQFREFQDACYPAHITALLRSDFERISKEVGLTLLQTSFTNVGRLPFTSLNWQIIPFLRGQMFSDNVLFLFGKSQ